MANVLGAYNPILFANEALMFLRKKLGIARTVSLVYHNERRDFRKGNKIQIPRPATFTASNAPNSSAQDAGDNYVEISLDQWKEVVFTLSDKERSAVVDRYISDHMEAAAYAIVDDLEQALSGLYTDVPWFYDLNATPGSVVTDVTGPRKILVDNKARMEPENLFYMIDPTLEAGLLANSAFGQWNGAGPTGERTQINGMLGTRFTLQHYMTQNVKSHVKGTLSDTTPLLVGAHAKGATTVVMDDTTLTGTLKKGDTFVIAGNAQRYSVAADATASGNAITVTITEPLVQAYSDNTGVTVRLDDHTANLVYNRNAFGIVNVLLPDVEIRDMGNIKVFTQSDPETGLSVRVTIWYEPRESATYCKVDALYGVKTFYGNQAVRACG